MEDCRIRYLVDYAADPFFVHNLSGQLMEVNQEACSCLGYDRDEILSSNIEQLDAAQDGTLRQLWSRLSPGEPHNYIGALKHRDGSQIPVEIRLELYHKNSQPLVLAMARRLFDAQPPVKTMNRDREVLKALVENLPHYVFWKDQNSVYQGCNSHFARIAGVASPDDILGKTDFDLAWTREEAEFFRQRDREVIQLGLPLMGVEQTQHQASGKTATLRLTKVPLTNDEGDIDGVLGIFENITKQKQTQDRLHLLSQYDSLTGLPNQTLFRDRTEQALARASRLKETVAVLTLDLDRFNTINNTLGRAVGDELLKVITARLSGMLRADDTIAKMGGDSFTLLLPTIRQSDDAPRVAAKLLESLAQPFRIQGQDLYLSASVGIALYPSDGQDAETLVRNASTALNQAKEQGRNSYRLYAPAMNSRALGRMNLENDLYRALERDEFILNFQPQIETKNGTLIGAEALVRWMHPIRGLVSPVEFIPLAEETGVIVPLGEWVLRQSCRQARVWLDSGWPAIRISVNLAARQLREGNFPALVKSILEEENLPASCLGLEITESGIMEDVDAAIDALKEIKALGVHLSIDDFGTGYSSLSYLKRFPVDMVKIDRSFVMDITSEKDDAAIVSAVIAMAETLSLKVLAEGVETSEQLEFLRARNCHKIQGYFISKPLAADDFGAFYQRHKCAINGDTAVCSFQL